MFILILAHQLLDETFRAFDKTSSPQALKPFTLLGVYSDINVVPLAHFLSSL